MANQIVTGQKVTFFDSIDFSKILSDKGVYLATYNSRINGELHPDTILGTDIGGAIFFSPPANSENAHITHGGKIYTLGPTVKTEVTAALENVKINGNIDVDGEITDAWKDGAILVEGLGDTKLTTTVSANPWEKELDIASTNLSIKDLLKIINLLCKEVADLKHVQPVPTRYAVPATLAATNKTYNGNSHALLSIVSSCSLCSMLYSLSSEGPYTGNIPTATNAGTYTVYWKAEADAGYTFEDGTTVKTGTVPNVKINKEQVTVNAPHQKTIPYTGYSQYLISSGSVNGSLSENDYTFKYKLSTASTYVTTLPTATNAGSYNVDWNVVLNNNNYEFATGTPHEGTVTGSKITAISASATVTLETAAAYGGSPVILNKSITDLTPANSVVSYYATKGTETPTTDSNWQENAMATSAGNWNVWVKIVPPTGNTNYTTSITSCGQVTVTEQAEEFYWFLGNGDTIGTWDDDNIQFVPGSIDVTKLTKQSGCPWSTDDSWAADGSLNCTIFFPYKYKGQIKTFANASKTAPVAINAFSNYVIDGVTYIASYANISPSTVIYLEIDI